MGDGGGVCGGGVGCEIVVVGGRGGHLRRRAPTLAESGVGGVLPGQIPAWAEPMWVESWSGVNKGETGGAAEGRTAVQY